MKHKARLFFGAFLVTAVWLAGVAGFLAVDLSTDRYMPGRFPRLFLVEILGPEGAALSWMGQRYELHAQAVGTAQQALWRYRSFLPSEARLTGSLAVELRDILGRLYAARKQA